MGLLGKETLLGVGIGAAIVVSFPYVRPVFAEIGRPLAKTTIKQALAAYERFRVRLTRMAEGIEDVIAEVRAEIEVASEERRIDGEAAQSHKARASNRPGGR